MAKGATVTAGDTLDIIQLRTLVAIADCGGFGRAASALSISQSTVSQHVRNLEKRLGRTLLEKDGRGARFTAAGDDLLAEARRIVFVHDDALLRLEGDAPRSIVIGSTETAADQLLPEMLRALRNAYPGVGLRFHIDRSTQLTERVSQGAIDLAILLGIGPDQPGVEVGTLPLSWYAVPGWTAPRAARPWPLVAYAEPCGMRRRAFQRLGLDGHLVEVVAESTSLEGVLAAARAGLGLAVLPNAGAVPQGLEVRDDLPALGDISVRLFSKPGVAVDVETAAFDALHAFFQAFAPTLR